MRRSSQNFSPYIFIANSSYHNPTQHGSYLHGRNKAQNEEPGEVLNDFHLHPVTPFHTPHQPTFYKMLSVSLPRQSFSKPFLLERDERERKRARKGEGPVRRLDYVEIAGTGYTT